MKRLVFKKWVEILFIFIMTLGLFIIAAFEWNSIIPYLIGISLIILSEIMLSIYGRS